MKNVKNTNDEVNSTGSAPISDAEMAAALANSPWAKMERDAKNVVAIDGFREEDWRQERCA
jgi:hypothetical protein